MYHLDLLKNEHNLHSRQKTSKDYKTAGRNSRKCSDVQLAVHPTEVTKIRINGTLGNLNTNEVLRWSRNNARSSLLYLRYENFFQFS